MKTCCCDFRDLKLQTGYYNVHGHALDVSQPRALSKGLIGIHVCTGSSRQENRRQLGGKIVSCHPLTGCHSLCQLNKSTEWLIVSVHVCTSHTLQG